MAAQHGPPKQVPRSPLYAPLDDTKKQIRTVIVLPGDWEDKICCELQTVSLQDYSWNSVILKEYYESKEDQLYAVPYATQSEYAEARRQYGLGPRKCSSQVMAFRRAPDPKSGYSETELDIPSCGSEAGSCRCFQALSYTWGLFTEHRTITIDGRDDFLVSDNAFAALLRLRSPIHNRRLWIDALCINQEDRAERASQVRLMADLYSSAPEVLIWLGEVDIDRVWNRVSREYPRVYSEPTVEGDQAPKWQMLSLAVEELTKGSIPLWFFRSWIVQEVVNAKYAPKFQLGAFQGNWLDLIRLFHKPPQMRDVQNALYALDSLRSGTREDRSLLDFLDSVRQRDCTDPRDKVYSLVGMVRREESSAVDVDYSQTTTPAQVYSQATYASILGDKSLRAFAFIGPQDQRTANLPSWAIDFAWKTDFELGTMYSPVSWTSRHPQVEPIVSTHANILQVRGLLLDEIQEVIPLTGDGNRWPKEYANFALDADCAASIISALNRLPSTDPYSLLNRTTTTQQPQPPPNWTDLLSCAQRNLTALRAEPALRHDRFQHSDLFGAWDRAVALRSRTSVPDYRDPAERDYTMGLGMGLTREATAKDRTFFTTQSGFLGLALRDVRVGDAVALLYGSRLPTILHPLGDGSAEYGFAGLALVNGVSYGELRDVAPGLELLERDFRVR